MENLLPLLALIAAAGALLAAVFAVIRLGGLGDGQERLRLLGEQVREAQRAEAETTRRLVADAERALAAAIQSGTTDALGRAFAELAAGTRAVTEGLATLRGEVGVVLGDLRTSQAQGLGEMTTRLATEQGNSRSLLESKLREMAEANAGKLAEIQASVNEQLHKAVEAQMTSSFQRVIDQFTAVQKAMGDVQAVTAQIGDIKRIFSNVKTRGGWGETQLRALLDDVLHADNYELNKKLRADSDDVVEFAIRMPMRGEVRPYLAMDAKFPVEDYERLITAAEAGDAEAERGARRALESRLRLEAKKISEKYINPPVTVDFAVMYLPTDGLYAEAARIPGLIDAIGRDQRVLVLGPALAPAMLRTIQLGFVTLALEQHAGEVRSLLGATRTEMKAMGEVLERLAKQAGTFSNTIEKARTRTRAVDRKLRAVELMESGESEKLLEIAVEIAEGEEE